MHPRDVKSAMTVEQIDAVREDEGGLHCIGTTRVRPLAGYESLAEILDSALHQAQSGKGHDRHAVAGLAFEEQLMSALAPLPFCVGQACKKAVESTRLDPIAAERDLLGAISYLVGEVQRRRKERG